MITKDFDVGNDLYRESFVTKDSGLTNIQITNRNNFNKSYVQVYNKDNILCEYDKKHPYKIPDELKNKFQITAIQNIKVSDQCKLYLNKVFECNNKIIEIGYPVYVPILKSMLWEQGSSYFSKGGLVSAYNRPDLEWHFFFGYILKGSSYFFKEVTIYPTWVTPFYCKGSKTSDFISDGGETIKNAVTVSFHAFFQASS